MNAADEGIVYEEFEVVEIQRENDAIVMKEAAKKVIAEVSLKMIVNGQELVSVLCLNRHHEELALGFLYNEGVIGSYEDIESIEYNEKMLAVLIELREGIVIDRRESLRSITSGCGKCYTYINPLKKTQYAVSTNKSTFSAGNILTIMDKFIEQSEIFHTIGGVHSVLFHTDGFEVLNEDIGRHNCFDKMTGILMKANKMELAANGMVFISGRLTSEMLMKMIRLGAPVVVSKSTPTTATIRLAREYNITLLGYVRGGKGTVYACPERLAETSDSQIKDFLF
ncbi:MULTISPECIES: formate dehydrogenase accessory sulfurtransferase FdhD [unclassified Dehalobacter]|jgi:FdhD protein|uniref:formate dehydrogenase accessory sulfurtransferase FdhD n=1 Tax=unclassified Dehalobacter TaxID=2635733 RepID=UPI0003002392|nr:MULTISPECIES: formate dehydrogenase accessory sulfurtransferase FdhD [unclassified Dehalobacter]MCG1025161.1 formate dehydrogenase accessory sulfurtransferase FdhD [Dehalobacter sp.]MDJ0304902.1 formate dehydrogenase accessory sulfurtransferase FdhD [Dehalobacter sp.]OCZ49401.1 formate dehydrogenase family accessory protein FdhD [Dehalobacter sp. TeCB1]